jgi:F0F1-type ATP synthase membrane subunit b/b'
MIKLLSSLLSLLDRLWAAWSENKLRQQGRQEAIKEANDEINRQIELGEAAIATPDRERDERLRNRFDRARAGK